MSTVKIVLIQHEHDLAVVVPFALLSEIATPLGRVPYLTYAAYSIMGVLGDLSNAPTGPPVSTEFDVENSILFFVPRSADARYSMADRFNVVSQRTTTTGEHDTEFLDALNERNLACLGTGSMGVTACHLVSVAAGSDYVRKLCDMRPTYTGEEVVSDINNVRNGILLDRRAHELLGKGLFLIRTPNHFLKTEHLVRQSVSLRVHRLQSAAFTFHWLQKQEAPERNPMHPPMRYISDDLPHGTVAYFFGEVSTETCPSSVILDFMFGSGFLQLFGTPELKEYAAEYSEREYGAIKREAIKAQELKAAQRAKERKLVDGRARDDPEAKLAAWEEMDRQPGLKMMWAISQLPFVVHHRNQQERWRQERDDEDRKREVERKRPDIEAWLESQKDL